MIASLPIDVEPPLGPDRATAVLDVSEQGGLTIYDGAYLELAHRYGLPLATLDSALVNAAAKLGVPTKTNG